MYLSIYMLVIIGIMAVAIKGLRMHAKAEEERDRAKAVQDAIQKSRKPKIINNVGVNVVPLRKKSHAPPNPPPAKRSATVLPMNGRQYAKKDVGQAPSSSEKDDGNFEAGMVAAVVETAVDVFVDSIGSSDDSFSGGGGESAGGGASGFWD